MPNLTISNVAFAIFLFQLRLPFAKFRTREFHFVWSSTNINIFFTTPLCAVANFVCWDKALTRGYVTFIFWSLQEGIATHPTCPQNPIEPTSSMNGIAASLGILSIEYSATRSSCNFCNRSNETKGYKQNLICLYFDTIRKYETLTFGLSVESIRIGIIDSRQRFVWKYFGHDRS